MRDLCKLATFVFYHSSCNDLYKLEGAASNHSFIATCVSMSKHQINNKSLIVYHTEKFNTPDSATGSSYLEVFFRKVVLRNFEKLAGKLLCQSLFFNKVSGLRLQISIFSPNAGKYGPEKTPYLGTFHAVCPLHSTCISLLSCLHCQLCQSWNN